MTEPELISELSAIMGAAHVASGADMARWSQDWSGEDRWTPLSVARPATAGEVAAILRMANDRGLPVVPVSGNTGMALAMIEAART